MNLIFIKTIVISFLYELFKITKFNFFLILIEKIGGPLFSKVYQNFNNILNLENRDLFSGTIGEIKFINNVVKKKLHKNIKQDLYESLKVFEEIIKLKKIKLPFYYPEYFQINMEQLNLNLERNYSIELKEIFKNINQIKIINIFESSSNYHLSYLINGSHINSFLIENNNSFFEREIYTLLYLSYYLMVSSNLFHCDWHFGNFLVNLDNNNKIVLYILDTGMMSRLDKKSHDKLKILLKTNLLKPEPINIIKFLCSINLNKDANLQDYSNISKEVIKDINFKDVENYKKILIKLFELSSKYNLKFPIAIIYMFQSIVFLNNFSEQLPSNIIEYSKNNNFYDKIIGLIN